MSKVFLFGIDSLDLILLNKFKNELPNFSKLMDNGPKISMTSVEPPDSASAWPSIFTGLNPAEHGMVYFVDPLDKVSSTVNEIVDSAPIKGKAFWDIAGQNGKRVCILFPHVCYPGWEVNGIMVVRDEVDNQIKSYPENIASGVNVSDLMVLQGLPTNNKKRLEYIEKGKKLILNEMEFSIQLYKKEEWDLFFTYSSVMDYISHNFWNYMDDKDPSYSGDNNPFKDTIKNFYLLYDQVLGEYLSLIDPDTIFFVFSDHGHGMRPPKVFDLNKYLTKMNLYFPKTKDNRVNPIATSSGFLLNSMKDYVNENPWTWNFAMRGLNLFPNIRKKFTTPPSVDWSKTIAYSSDQSGIKAYNYGGVIINTLEDEDYERTRNLIINKLKDIEVDSKKLFRFVCKREDIYSGPFISKYPDLVFELTDEYGIGQIQGSSLFGECSTHNIQPGSHKRYSTVFLTSNLNHFGKQNLTLMDIRNIILNLL